MPKLHKSFLLLIVPVCLLFLGVAGLSAAPTKIVVMFKTSEVLESHIKAFEAENPNIKVELIQDDWNRAMAMIAAGSPPNLMRANGYDIPYLACRGLLQDIDKYLDKGGKYVQKSDFEPIMDNFRYDAKTMTFGKGSYYGLNKDYSLSLDIWYRKDIFRECGIPEPSTTEPMTYEELYQICKKLVKREGDRTIRYAIGGIVPAQAEIFLSVCLASEGKKLYSDDYSKVLLTSQPEAVKIAKYLVDVMKERLSPSPIDPADTWDVPLMLAGRQAMYHYGYWAGAYMYDQLKPEQLGYFPAPIWGKKWLNTASNVGMIMLKAPNSDAAWKFMDFFIGGPPCVERAKSGWGLPPFKSMVKYVPQATPIQKTALNVTLAQMDNSIVTPINPYIRRGFDAAWKKHLEDVLKNKCSLEDFLKKVENEVNQAIADGMATVK